MVDVLEGTSAENLRVHPYTLKDLAGSDIVLTRETESIRSYHYGSSRQEVERLKPFFDQKFPVNTVIEVNVGPKEIRYFNVVAKPGSSEENSIYVKPAAKPENLEELREKGLVVSPSVLQSLGEY